MGGFGGNRVQGAPIFQQPHLTTRKVTCKCCYSNTFCIFYKSTTSKSQLPLKRSCPHLIYPLQDHVHISFAHFKIMSTSHLPISRSCPLQKTSFICSTIIYNYFYACITCISLLPLTLLLASRSAMYFGSLLSSSVGLPTISGSTRIILINSSPG